MAAILTYFGSDNGWCTSSSGRREEEEIAGVDEAPRPRARSELIAALPSPAALSGIVMVAHENAEPTTVSVAALIPSGEWVELASVAFRGGGAHGRALRLRERKALAFAAPLRAVRVRFTCDPALPLEEEKEGAAAAAAAAPLAKIELLGEGAAAAEPRVMESSAKRRGRVHWPSEQEALSEQDAVLSRIGLSPELMRSPFDAQPPPPTSRSQRASRGAAGELRLHPTTQRQVVALRRRQRQLAADEDFDRAMRVRDAVRELEGMGLELLALEERYQIALLAGNVAAAEAAENASVVLEGRCDLLVDSVSVKRLQKKIRTVAPLPTSSNSNSAKLRLAQAKKLSANTAAAAAAAPRSAISGLLPTAMLTAPRIVTASASALPRAKKPPNSMRMRLEQARKLATRMK